MGGGIYYIQDDDRLVEMLEQAYETEERLQEWLEQYPNLLAGDRSDPANPRQWLLVSRETPVPNEEDGAGRWSLDRLFLDRNAIPTLVAVRSISNIRLRQEIVGQMLDYAANAIVHWPIDAIITQFEANCREQGRDPEQVFERFLGADADEERFWQKVKTHLQAGKIRLVFVADEIRVELRRIVEFLNEQMDPAEVLAIEIKQYADFEEGIRTLMARTIGQTAGAKQKKSSLTRGRRQWDEISFFQELEVRRGKDEAFIARQIYDWAHCQTPALEVEWGTGDTYGGFAVHLQSPVSNTSMALFRVGIWGGLEISSRTYAAQDPFETKDQWQELRSQLSAIGLALPNDPAEPRFPFLRLSTLQDEQEIERVLETFEWVVGEIQNPGN